jgi:predicted DNA-binding WGR domain protein
MPTRYFENTDDGNNKFWEISWTPNKAEYTTRWGRIGSSGITKKKTDFKNIIDAATSVRAIIRSKINKGYKEKEEPINKKLDYLEIW